MTTKVTYEYLIEQERKGDPWLVKHNGQVIAVVDKLWKAEEFVMKHSTKESHG